MEYHDDVRSKVIDDCLTEMPKHIGPKVDGVLVTGDIAYSAEAAQYQKAGEFIEKICQAGDCGSEDVFLVPGNHDVHLKTNWTLGGHLINKALRSMQNVDEVEKELERFEQAPPGHHPLTLKFEGYNEFARQFNCQFIKSPVIPRKFKDLHFDGFGFLRILGINSAIVSDEEDDLGRLFLSQKQYILEEKDGMEYLVMMHHPTTWFRNKNKVENKFNNRVKLLLTGHEHSLAIKTVGHGAGGQQILLESGACNPPGGAEFNYSYTWIEISVYVDESTKKPHLKVKVFPRVWAPARDRFIEDTQRLETNNGSSEFTVLAPRFATPAIEADKDKVVVATDSPLVSEELHSIENEEVDKSASDDDERMSRVRYIFWSKIKWQQRIEILCQLNLIGENTETKMPYDLEYWALTQAQENGLLGRLWDAMMDYLPAEERFANPYMENANV